MITTIISGIFAYLFAMEISKKNRVLSTICAVFYIFLPYRVFCAACRQAYSEAVALSFLTVVFYGAYRIVHDDKFYVAPYVTLIVGASLMILSHPFTALMCAIFGALYIILYLYKIIKTKSYKRILVNLAVSALIIFFLVGFYVTLALHTRGMNIFRLNDDQIMWTNFEHVKDSTLNSMTFSGFLNFFWIYGTSYTFPKASLLILGFFLYFICICAMIVIDNLIVKLPKSKYYRYPVDLIGLFIIPAIFWQRAEFYISLGISYFLFILLNEFADKALEQKPVEQKLSRNLDLYFVGFGIIVCLILIFVGDAWKAVPSILYSCQFAWRLFGFLYFFLFYLAIIVLDYLKKYTYTNFLSAITASFFVLFSMPLFEKSEAYYNNINLYEVADEEWLKTITYSGAQNEMVPSVFYEDGYKSEYNNSLFNIVRIKVRSYSGFIYTMEDYLDPAFLTGDGSIAITELKTPCAKFSVSVDTDTALVQFPQFYQDGYYGVYNNNTVYGSNVDGLLSFELTKGQYELSLNFSRTKPYNVLAPFFYVGIGLTFAYAGVGTYQRIRANKKAHNQEPTQN